MNKIGKAYAWPLIIGAVLILVGLIIQVPGGVLTTLETRNGESTDNYVFDDEYSSIDEYVGGDAYNYIIGASLVAGKISGTMTVKAVCIVGGLLCICAGMVLLSISKNGYSIEYILNMFNKKQNTTPIAPITQSGNDSAPTIEVNANDVE